MSTPYFGFLQSMSAVNMVKKDLAEFTSTMHQDTTRIAGEVKTRVMVRML